MAGSIGKERVKQPFFIYQKTRFQVVPIGPAQTEVPLQIVCFFDYTKNQEMSGGTLSVDEHYHGEIRALRQGGHFPGKLYETLLLIPSHGEISAGRLLLIGLGDPDELTEEVFSNVGRIAVNEANKLGVKALSFAPSIRDAAVTNYHAGDVASQVLQGMVLAIDSSRALADRDLIPAPSLEEVYMLAGEAHLEGAQKGMRDVFFPRGIWHS
ncbi:MAG: hypothetical protein J7501_12325 [Bdellovibrio sp.]|nr:hypothetical protein [Bdellovibrio sp.]